MSQELIYTSAPRGLKPGSRGFCTVVSTQGMPAALAQRLEALSGYRPVYGPQDPNARLNPVACSHLLLSVSGRRLHVLSRVCDAGLDYTQRTNKFAHHVVLDGPELVPAGPAWLLAAPEFMQATWDGEPKILPAGRRPPMAAQPAAVCAAWQQATGDAGWGGVLAETASNGAVRPAVIVFRPGIDPLPLVAESLALLPPEARWNVAFSTYFSKLPPGVDCHWRCVLEGSPEAIAARRVPGALVIDVSAIGRAGSPPPSDFVQAARTGVAPIAAPAARPALPTGTRQPAGSSAEPARPLAATAATGASPAPLASPELESYGLEPLTGPSAPPPRPGPPMRRKFKRKEKSHWPMTVAIAGGLLVLGAAGAAFWASANRHRQDAEVTGTQVDGRSTEAKSSDAKSAAKTDTASEKAKAEERERQRKEKERKDREEEAKRQKEAEAREAQAKADREEQEKKQRAADALAAEQAKQEAKKKHLDECSQALARLPKATNLPDYRPGSTMEPVPLGDLPGQCDDYRIDLLGTDDAFGASKYAVLGPEVKDSEATWAFQLTTVKVSNAKIAALVLKGGKLYFRWLQSSADQTTVAPLSNCLLQLGLSGAVRPPPKPSQVLVRLRTPKNGSAPLPLPHFSSPDRKSQSEKSYPVDVQNLPPKAKVRLDILDPIDPPGACLKQLSGEEWLLDLGGAIQAHFAVRLHRPENKEELRLVIQNLGITIGDGARWQHLGRAAPKVDRKTKLAQIKLDQVKKHHEFEQGELAAGRASLASTKEKLAVLQKKDKPTDQDKAEIGRLRGKVSKLEQEVKDLERYEKDAAELVTTCECLEKQTRLPYRVYVMIGGNQVDLVRAGGEGQDAAGEKPKPSAE